MKLPRGGTNIVRPRGGLASPSHEITICRELALALAAGLYHLTLVFSYSNIKVSSAGMKCWSRHFFKNTFMPLCMWKGKAGQGWTSRWRGTHRVG